MRYGFFSDVHSNEEALKIVIRDFQAEKLDQVFFLGDAVGYGPNPNESLTLINEISEKCLMGNHDYAALGLIETNVFNLYAQESMNWTLKSLTEKSLEIMSNFLLDFRFENFHLVHSTPNDPTAWDYILDLDEGEKNFAHFNRQICLIGHSHVPSLIKKYKDRHCTVHLENSVYIEEGFRYIINVGSVGQPRDGINQSCYLIYDSVERKATLKRIPYNVKKTQQKMKKAGLPQYLIERIAIGR
jgi:predicted phosphodiesterase